MTHRTMSERSYHGATSRSDSCNKASDMYYPVCRMVHIKYPLLPIEKSNPCSGDSGIPLSLSEWSFTMCKCVECVFKYFLLNMFLTKTGQICTYFGAI